MTNNIFVNKKADITITILVIGVIVVCCFALVNFYSTTRTIRNNFVGIGLTEKLNSQVEENHFRGFVSGLSETPDIHEAIVYAEKNVVVNRKCHCGNDCNSYAEFISDSVLNKEIDAILMLALMMQESDCTQKASSGSSIGLMQINLANCGGYGLPSDEKECKNLLINNPQFNIEIGAQILREKYDLYNNGRIFQGCTNRNVSYSGWEAALRGYNGWGCGTDLLGNKIVSQDLFVEEVMERYNKLKSIGNFEDKTDTSGILWWRKEVTSFSVEYLGKV